MASIQDQPERVSRAYLHAIGAIAMVTIPLSGVCIIVAPELVNVTLGTKWAAMTVPFQILIASLLFRTSYKISDSLALATGSMKSRAVRQWIYALAVAGGALLGTPRGLDGVSAGVAAAVLLNFLMMLQLALRLTKISFALVVRLHVRHSLAALPVIIATAMSVELARKQGASSGIVLAAGGFAAAVTWTFMWWKFRRVFGENGEWAFQLAVDRLGPLLRKLSRYLPSEPGGSPIAPAHQAVPNTRSRAEI